MTRVAAAPHLQGMTLVELLIGMALTAIVMTVLLNFFVQSITSSSRMSSMAEQQQELLNAQQLIAGNLKDAWYVYPASQTIVLPSTSPDTVRNPIAGSNSWTTGTHPILAMILPPADLSAACNTNVAGCYRFISYYAVKRSVWVQGTAATPWRNPGDEPGNADTWVLAEYRANMPSTFNATVASSTFVFPPATPPTVPLTGAANLLSDHVAPTVATTGLTTGTYTMFQFSTAGTGTAAYVNGVTINLATVAMAGGRAVRQPSGTDTYSLAVFPANVGRRPVRL